ncbi:uncharacterized protein LOC109824990 isoform X2 [Asparagus officinalis]|uniref:uncharacterized protein LOC109824990 isoform X2 n=1 Tax=Asparagus officinalis TaxID=4686 RepID=UPI00098E20AA|nr:uncharacterized protein LOC109824990 isoform X2 [Asparagus officinalis]
MIVRTYGRRTRDINRSFSDPESPDFIDFPLSQESSQDPLAFSFGAAFSSQDSDSSGQDPTKTKEKKKKKQMYEQGEEGEDVAAPAVAATATLMEAQEFGEMMEHVDEVNFALDGLRPGQPTRIRRASLLSLLSICGTPQQRVLVRAQGMAKRIVDSILGLNFDDLPSTLAAATLFFVLASDVHDDHLLDSPPCIRFLLELLNPPVTDTVEGRAPTIGSKLLRMRRPQVASVTNTGTDSSSRVIISKVQEILVSCKEIKSGVGDDEGMHRPELSSKWISLLTMEKACLSTVSFEEASESVRKARGNFKERLREYGGLDAIFDVVISCHSTMERWLKCRSSSVSELKNGAILESVILLLKCLKILENATFLSKDNQGYLLGMRNKIDSEGLSMSFVGVVVSSIKFLSDLALLKSPLSICNKGKLTCHTENVGIPFNHVSAQFNESKRDFCICRPFSSTWQAGNEVSKERNLTCHKRQKFSASPSELTDCGSEAVGVFRSNIYSGNSKIGSNASKIHGRTSSGSNGGNDMHTNGLKVNISANGLRMSVITSGLKGKSDNFSKHARGWISLRAIGSKTDSCIQSKRSHMSEDTKDGHATGSCDPFAFDEGEFEPSKWETLARKKSTSRQSTANKNRVKGCDDFSMDIDQMLSESTTVDSHKSWEEDCPSVSPEDSNLVEDCLLAAVKVLMNLTNDNPVGCQQIAACGGLDTMVSLIVNNFPSYNLSFPVISQLKEDVSSSTQSTSCGSLSNRHLTDHSLDFLVAILGLLVNLVEKDSRNRLCLASARVLVEGPATLEMQEKYMDVIPLLCSIFLANQGAGDTTEEGKLLLCDDEALVQGEQEAEMMIVEAYAALLLAFVSTESTEVREAISSYLPNHNLEALVPVLERFVLNMISPETHAAVVKVIESCKGP